MTNYRESTNHVYSLAKNVLSKFTEQCGGNEYALSINLHERFIVDDFAYHDDMQYFGVYEYFSNVVIPHKIAVFKSGMHLISRMESHLFLPTSEINLLKQNLWEHDLSKFSANEAFGYAGYNFKDPHPQTIGAFQQAWHHHKMNNPHHPEYWMNPNRSGKMEPIMMPDIYIVEMIADWMGAGQTYGSTLEQWLPANLPKFNFGPSLRRVQEILLKLTGINTVFDLADYPPLGPPEKTHDILVVNVAELYKKTTTP